MRILYSVFKFYILPIGQGEILDETYKKSKEKGLKSRPNDVSTCYEYAAIIVPL